MAKIEKPVNTQITQRITKKKGLFIIAYGKSDGNISAACESIGISRRIYYIWIEKDKKFKQAVEDAYEETIDWVESKLLAQIKENNITAIIFYLKTKGQSRGYVERQKVDISDWKPIKIFDIENEDK